MALPKTELFQGREIVRQQDGLRRLGHERGAGAACLKCGPKCEGGLDLHFWRKICRNCHCLYEDHDVKSEEEIHHDIVRKIFRTERGLGESVGKLNLNDWSDEPVISKDVKANFIQAPSGTSKSAMVKFLDAIPKEKAAHRDMGGSKYRNKQLNQQLPAHDFDDSFCDDLSEQEKAKMKEFDAKRNAEAAGQGTIKENDSKQLSKWVCEKCRKALAVGEVAIFADRAGPNKCWHPGCFVCIKCNELLVDLIYFWKDGLIFCGRHYGEQIRVRCAACDELIFSKEYTQAEDRCWHLKHFCCFTCDTQLGGHKYVARENKPYCMDCYDKLFAKTCHRCRRGIPADAKRISYKEHNWHATEQCFGCNACGKSMLGQQFIYKEEKVFCSAACARKT